MIRTIGVPSEIKDGERRIALEPSAVAMAVSSGFEVRVQSNGGIGAGFVNQDYQRVGARIVSNAAEVWESDLVVKVKEPQPAEWQYFREGLHLFAYLHLAAEPDLARALMSSGVEAFAFETLSYPRGLPLLAPMSEVAGRAAAIMGAYYLASGSGTLLGGAAGVLPARVVIVGMGVAGTMAARGARGMDAEVTGVDIDLSRLYELHQQGIITASLASSEMAIGEAVASADLVIGAALVPGARAPKLITREHVESMRPGSVVLDLAIDQGGCIETSRPTSLSHPTFIDSGVVHYCVTNVPGQYPRTSSRALSAAVAPRLLDLARDPASECLAGALNVSKGQIVYRAVSDSLGF